jgi:hypothetical protein
VIERDEHGVLHVVALSGGHDSTALALLLKEREPRPYAYVCTPTGNEAPAMFAHWNDLSVRLGSRLIPIMAGTLGGLIKQQNALPNFRQRWCTRKLKIEPFIAWLLNQLEDGPVVAYVGLRADEPTRVGGVYGQLGDIQTRCPLREWGYGEDEVQAALRERDCRCPNRTDCLVCYHQRIGEWYECWLYHNAAFMEGVQWEAETGHTFRTPGRDSWPSSLKELGEAFAAGRVPTISLNRMNRERMAAGGCRACSM